MTWALTIASLIGVVANIYKKRWAFAIWIGTNGAWAVIDFQAGIYAQSALFCCYFVLAVIGWFKWR